MSDAPSPPPLDPAASVEGLLDLARARAKAGDAAGAGRTFAAALHLAEAHDLWGPTARAQAWLAGIDVRRGRLTLARERLDRARAICADHPVSDDVHAEVAAQLGQVLVFQGQAGAGVALMAEAVGRFRALGRSTERDELELALAAVTGRVEQAVQDAPAGSDARVHALVRRAEVRLGLGSRGPARSDFQSAWQASSVLPAASRARIGLQYGQLLIADGPDHHNAALAVLLAVRPDLPAQLHAEADALIARAHTGGPEN